MTPGLKRCLVAKEAESSAGSSFSPQRISWQATSRESGTPEHRSSAYEPRGCRSVQAVCPTLTITKSYMRPASEGGFVLPESCKHARRGKTLKGRTSGQSLCPRLKGILAKTNLD